MTLIHITAFVLTAIAISRLVPIRYRVGSLLVGSLLAVAWLSAETMPGLQAAIFYVVTIGITILVWFVTNIEQVEVKCAAFGRAASIVALSILVSVIMLVGRGDLSAATLIAVILAGAGLLLVLKIVSCAELDDVHRKRLALSISVGLIAVLVMLKTPSLASFGGGILDWNSGNLTGPDPLIWLGFSYFAFRLMAILLDTVAGRFPGGEYSLAETISYVIFFPAYTAGPIDRAQRFIPELQVARALNSARLVEGVGRILVGLVKKFIIADTLAIISLNPELIDSTSSVIGLWVLVYSYAFQIYLDFSGYSDIAIGIGILLGIRLPENFDQPYLRPNIQQFWQNWHITLSTWFRVYFFMPFTRWMIQWDRKPPQWLIVLSAQICTMVLIGLWHGVTLNFIVWGLWHGIGLFVYKVISDNSRRWHRRVTQTVLRQRFFYATNVFVTFHFVVLGWIFFALPDVAMGFKVLTCLIGIGEL